jgi:hypothetical protein
VTAARREGLARLKWIQAEGDRRRAERRVARADRAAAAAGARLFTATRAATAAREAFIREVITNTLGDQ